MGNLASQRSMPPASSPGRAAAVGGGELWVASPPSVRHAGVVRPLRVRRQHDWIERVDGRELVDTAGQVSAPWRAVPLLEAMERRGVITRDMREAGEAFHALFRLAQLDGLRSASLFRAGGSGSFGVNGNERARKATAEAIAAMGGSSAPAASCVWHVLGLEWSLRRWTCEFRRGSVNEASGILVAALGVLAGGRR